MSYDYSHTRLAAQISVWAASGSLSLKEFLTKAKDLDVGDRTIAPTEGARLGRGSYGQAFINFYNVPSSKARGAKGENNRQMFTISGFDKEDPEKPVDKVKIELSVNTLSRDYQLRAKSASPEAILTYLQAHLKKVVSAVEPKL